jgi:hypothetical protein
MAFRVMRARPTDQFTLTMIGYTPEEWSISKKRFLRQVRKADSTFEWWMSVEISPDYRLPHVHGFSKGRITPDQFQQAATNAGFGISELKTVPESRSRIAEHFGYPMKSLDNPEIRAAFLDWNAKGSRIGFESHSRGFFNSDTVKAAT